MTVEPYRHGYDQGGVLPASRPEPVVPARQDTDSWARMMGPLLELAEHVHNTDFVPGSLRGNAPATAAAMLYGRELGMGPMRALQTVHVIDGRPTLAAEQMRGMVLAAGHEIIYRETTTQRCVVAGRRKGQTAWTTVTWTLDDAKRMNLLGKPNWRRGPRQMLVARATGELARMIFSDVVAGMAASEEAIDGYDGEGQAATGETPDEPKRKRTAQRRTTTAKAKPKAAEKPAEPAPAPDEIPAPEPAPPPLPGDEEPDDEDARAERMARPASNEQLTKLHVQLNELDITRREDQLVTVGLLAQRTLDTSKQLTMHEASQVMDTLTRILDSDDPKRHLDVVLAELEEHS